MEAYRSILLWNEFSVTFRVKGTVPLDNKLFLNSTHLLDNNFCAKNNDSKVFILKISRRFQNTH